MKLRTVLFINIFFFMWFSTHSQTSVNTDLNERILDYTSHIKIHEDGRMVIRETITVFCGGKQIKRGIYRDFPTKYKGRFGNTIKVDFTLLQVLKDGQDEPHHITNEHNGIRVYIGLENVYLKSGIYTYTITYQTDRQIGFFENFDELYWNVTGNGWNFTIEQAKAIIKLPPNTPVLNAAAYTGIQGARGGNFLVHFDQWENITFQTTKPLNPGEGLTIGVSWPKGIVIEPTYQDKINYFVRDNREAAVVLIGLIILFIYYIFAWARVGRDPQAGTIIPLYKPPERFSPAAIRFIMRMGYDHKGFAAAIVNMAVKGFITIEEKKGNFTLRKSESNEIRLSKGEKKMGQKLFGFSNTIVLRNTNHRKIQGSISALKKVLKRDFEKNHFKRNSSFLIPGYILSAVILVGMILTARIVLGAAFIAVWLSGWSVGCYFLVRSAIHAWKAAISSRGAQTLKVFGAGGISLFALPFVGFEIFGLSFFSYMVSPLGAFMLLVMILINVLFHHLMKAPSIYGRRVMDKIEGFKMYLSVAEKERLNMLHSPSKTPELFEKYLPYAMALDVENAWSEQFEKSLKKAGEKGEYSPSWYSGRSWNRLGVVGLASSLGSSFSSAIASSSTAPGSSSGSSGGGSSGGGGGGGGGGGW